MNCSLKWNGRHSSSRVLKWDASSPGGTRPPLSARAGPRCSPTHPTPRFVILSRTLARHTFFHPRARRAWGWGGRRTDRLLPLRGRLAARLLRQPTKGGDSGLCKEHSKKRRGATMPQCDSNGFLRRVRVRMGVETNATPLCYLRARAWRSNHVVCEVRKRGGFVGTKTNNITHRTQPGLSNRNMRCAQIMESGTGGVLHRSDNLSRRGKGGLSAQEREVCLIVKTTRVNLSMGSTASGAEKNDSKTGRPKRGAPANLAGCERRAQCRPSHALRMMTGSQPPPHPNMPF